MASKDHNVEERQVDASLRQSLHESVDEKANAMHSEDFHGAAERGHAATDKYVLALTCLSLHNANKLSGMANLWLLLTPRPRQDCA